MALSLSLLIVPIVFLAISANQDSPVIGVIIVTEDASVFETINNTILIELSNKKYDMIYDIVPSTLVLEVKVFYGVNK